MGVSVPGPGLRGRGMGDSSAGEEASALEHASACEWAAWRDIDVHVHRQVHRYLATCLHGTKQHVLWCGSRLSAPRVAREARRQATRAPRSVVKRTRTPARASMSTRASMLKRWKRRRTRSFTRGWLTPSSFAARA